jgi:sugar O-acyltransferase (sialic acid O-acetyltransferase NeuD family)
MIVYIIGDGRFAYQLKDILIDINSNVSVIFVSIDEKDSRDYITEKIFWGLLKTSSDLNVIVGLGYKHQKKRIELINALKQKKINIINAIHPSAFVHDSASIGQGIVIYPHTIVEKNTILSDGIIINTAALICHDSTIGKGTFIAPRTVVLGDNTIGEYCFIGANSTIKNGLIIGDNSTVGFGTRVTNNLNNNSKKNK